ncbi:MAG: N-glycosylase/DNA lyase [Nanopusillaceae archaeon]
MDKLKEIISKFSIDEILEYEEKYDKQYINLKKLYNNIKNEQLFLKISVINSLLAFQLIYKGEKFWEIFSEYFSKDKIDIYSDFVQFIEKHNFRFKKTKIARLNKIYSWIKDKDLLKYKDRLTDFNRDIAIAMNQKVHDKTIVFTTKIFGYAIRILGYKIVFPMDIAIPIDNRISKISKDMNYWWKLSKDTNIPPLHIDSLIWITYGLTYDEIKNINEDFREKILELKNLLECIIKNY